MSALTILITIVYVFLLRWITKPVLYTSLLGVEVLLVLIGFFAFQRKDDFSPESNNYVFAFGIAIGIWVLAALFLLFICCQWENISLGASIMTAAADFLGQNSKVGILPIISYILCIPIVAWWGSSAVFIYSMGEPKFDWDLPVASIEMAKEATIMFWVFLFGFFWIIAFLVALEQFIIAATACMWYFSGDGSDVAVSFGDVGVGIAAKWGFRYHLGSVAFGAFLVAVVTTIKVVFEYFAAKYEKVAGKDNCVFKAVTCCIRYCIWCLDAYIKFINKNAYIQIALHNSSFCKAAKESFYLMIRHAGRFTSLNVVGWLITFLGKGIIVGLSVWISILIMGSGYPQIQQPIVPAVIVGFAAYIVSSIFLSVFDFAALAILHCFIMDQDFGGSTRTPQSLQPFLDKNDEINDKKKGKQ